MIQESDKIKSMSHAVKVVIDSYPLGHKFYGNELHEDVVEIYPEAKRMYVDTILKMARRHRRDSYKCVDQNNSLYERVESDNEKILRFMKEALEAKENQPMQEKQLELFCA